LVAQLTPQAQQPNWVRRIGESIDYAETDPTALTFLAVLRQGLATVGRARETICTSTFDEPQATQLILSTDAILIANLSWV